MEILHQKGDLRVWWTNNLVSEDVIVSVKSADEAVEVINTEANKQLKNSDIQWNAFDLQVLEEGVDGFLEWNTWYHPETFEDISEYKSNKEQTV